MFRRALLTLLLVVAGVSSAHAQHFGRNKVQYRAFDFKIIKTEHFDVYFYEQERTAALDAARMAERSYARLSRLLQHEFRDRKPIILYASHSDFQQTNATYGFLDEGTGGFAEPIKSRLVLPFTGSYADFDHVLTHELVHSFQHDILYTRSMMNEATPFTTRPPLWFMEGMAEYLSVGRIDAHTESWLRDASLSGYLRDIGQMNLRNDYLSYRFGQSLWAYIGERWGNEVIGVLLQKAPRMGLERAFESTLGVTLAVLSAEWMSAVRSRYLPQLAEHQRPDALGTRLTAHDKLEDPWFLAPALSADGESLLFLSQRDGFFFDLFLADAATGRVRRKLVTGAQESIESLRYMNSSASFSPDGRLVAFSGQSEGRDALYIYDIDREKIVKRLRFELNGVANPSWSPDGKSIVFTGLDGGISDLFITDLEGGHRRLTNDKHADLLPAWSPDGRTIAFSTDRGDDADLERLRYGNLRVALYDLATGRIDMLPQQETGKNLNPVWSPDGRALAWISDRTGVNDVYLFDMATGELSRVTNFLSGVIAITPSSPALSWSRAGALAFVYFENAGYNIYSMADPLALTRVPVGGEPLIATAEQQAGAGAGAGAGTTTTTPRDSVTGPGTGPWLGPPSNPSSVPIFTLSATPSVADSSHANSFYRSDSGFRSSATLPAGTRAKPLSIVAMRDSLDAVLPDAGEFEISDYNVKFTPDMVGRPTIGAQVGGHYGSGVYGGSYISMSDMLGNHSIVLAGQVNGSFSDAQFLGGYTFLKRRANLGFALQQVPFYRYLGGGAFTMEIDGREEDVVADVLMRDVIRSAQGIVSYPFSAYRRIELGISATNFQRDVLYRGFTLDDRDFFDEDEEISSMSFVEPSAAFVFDNALFGWTGPVYGRRARVQLSRTIGDFGYTEALADLRSYFNFRQKAVLAGRFVGLARFGEDADRFGFFWGGPYYIRGYDAKSFDREGRECAESRLYGGTRSISPCPVRDQLIGSSAAFANIELRVPVITELQLGFVGAFPPVDAVVFVDGGMAWDNRICSDLDYSRLEGCGPDDSHPVSVVWDRKPGQDPYLVREPLFSYGIGLRWNVFYTILRMDYAWAVNRPETGGRFSISLGPSF